MRRPSYFSPGIILFVWVMTGCGPSRIVYQHADTLGGQKDVWVIREDGRSVVRASVMLLCVELRLPIVWRAFFREVR